MAVTQDQVDALRDAAAAGVLLVKFSDGREVRYDSLAAMLDAADRLERRVAGAAEFPRTTSTSFGRD